MRPGAREIGRGALPDGVDVHAIGARSEAARHDLYLEPGAILEDVDATAVGALGIAKLGSRVGRRQRARRMPAHAGAPRQSPGAEVDRKSGGEGKEGTGRGK